MRVLCKLPNASDRISGVAFEAADGGMLSDDLGDEAAQAFLRIPGYEAAQSRPKTARKPRDAGAPETNG